MDAQLQAAVTDREVLNSFGTSADDMKEEIPEDTEDVKDGVETGEESAPEEVSQQSRTAATA